ncbi:hypothetical protein CHU98_g3669 [Xylaria longipes]|nr:hypothetical protein CHU98_g3669 [Xylaria longipes]
MRYGAASWTGRKTGDGTGNCPLNCPAQPKKRVDDTVLYVAILRYTPGLGARPSVPCKRAVPRKRAKRSDGRGSS